MKNANLNKYIQYILHWHSTALTLAPLTFAGSGDEYQFPALESDGSVLWDQASGRAKAIAHQLTCDSRGQLALRKNSPLFDPDERETTVTHTLEDSDWTEIDYEYHRPPRVHWLEATSILTSTKNATADGAVVPAFAIAPGKAPGQGMNQQSQNYQLTQSKEELYKRTGHQYARVNEPVQPPRIRLAHGNDAGIEPADMQWIRFNMTQKTLRDRRFVNDRFLPQEVTIILDNDTGVKDVDITLELETVGLPGIDNTPPSYDWPEYEYPWDIYPIINYGDSTLADIANDLGIPLALMGVGYLWNNPIGWTQQLTASAVVWANAVGNMSGTIKWATGAYVGGAFRVYVVTADGTTGRIYRNPDALTDETDWTLDHTFTFTGSTFTGKVVMSQSLDADLVVCAWRCRDGVRYVRRWEGTWGGVDIVGSFTYLDDDHTDDVDFGLAVIGTKQVCCGMSGDRVYRPWYAVGNNQFDRVEAIPHQSKKPISAIAIDSDGNLWCESCPTVPDWALAYADGRSIWNTTPAVTATRGTDSSSGNNVIIGTDGTGVGASQFRRTDSWTLNNPQYCDFDLPSIFYVRVAFNAAHPTMSAITIHYTASIQTRHQGTITVSGSETVSFEAESGLADIATIIVHWVADTELQAPFIIEQITGLVWCDAFDFVSATIDNVQLGHTWGGENSDHDKGWLGVVYHCDNFESAAPAWTDVTPDTADRLPAHPFGIAVDVLDNNNIALIGQDSTGNSRLYRSSDKGASWDSAVDTDYTWLKFASDLFLLGGAGKFAWSTDALETIEDRLGDYAEQVASPDSVEGVIVLFGAV